MTFVIQNTFLSKNDSVVTGSLQITSTISASHTGTASYVLTSSYSENSATSSYTSATTISTSSYTLYSVSSSIAATTSYVAGLYYGPNANIGYLSPNIHIGSPNNFAATTTGTTYNGIMLTPILINKPCTLTTMSIVGGAAGAVTASFGIYSNSNTTNLPEYLLTSGSLRTSTGGPAVFHISNFSTIPLNANTVYWVAFLPSTTGVVGGISNWRWLTATAPARYIAINPLLHARVSYNTASLSGLPNWAIRTGSNPTSAGPFLPSTCSQDTGSYSLPVSVALPCLLPILKVTYT